MPMARHFTLQPHAALNVHVSCVLHRVFHLLCAVLALGSAMYNMKNLMFVTPASARIAHAIVSRGGVGIARNFRVVWCANIVDFSANIHEQC